MLKFPGPDFVRQLAAFQMLRDQFRLKLTGEDIPPERPARSALSAGPLGGTRREALGLGARTSDGRNRLPRRNAATNRSAAARSSSNCWPRTSIGFRAWRVSTRRVPADTWRAAPTHTLRFAEVLAKIYASNFTHRGDPVPIHGPAASRRRGSRSRCKMKTRPRICRSDSPTMKSTTPSGACGASCCMPTCRTKKQHRSTWRRIDPALVLRVRLCTRPTCARLDSISSRTFWTWPGSRWPANARRFAADLR